MYVYEKVRFYIEYYGIKQNAVAKKAGISNVTFNAILNGKRKLYADDLRAICIALNVPPEMFIDLRDTAPSAVPLENLTEYESDNQ